MMKPKRERPQIIIHYDKNKKINKTYGCKYCPAIFHHPENYELHYMLTHKESDSCSFFGICSMSPLE